MISKVIKKLNKINDTLFYVRPCDLCKEKFNSNEVNLTNVYDLIKEIEGRGYSNRYFTVQEILLNYIVENDLSENYKSEIETAISLIPYNNNSQEVKCIETVKQLYICENCLNRLEDFDNRYKDAMIRKSSVELYNTNYKRDLSYLGGTVFNWNTRGNNSTIIYDRVKFLTAFYGCDIVYNVVYCNEDVTGVIAVKK